jgi:large subunit ribosomal protein L29
MKKSAKADLRAKSADDLQAQAKELRESLLKARFATALEGTARSIQYRNARRQIARIQTLLTQKSAASQKVKS